MFVHDIPALQLYTALYELPQFFEFISERDARWYSDRRYAELRCPFCGGTVSAKWKDGFPRFTSHNPAKCSHFRSTSPIDFYAMLSGTSFSKAKDILAKKMATTGIADDDSWKYPMPSEESITKENAERIGEALACNDLSQTALALSAKGISYDALPEIIQGDVAFIQNLTLLTSSGHERVDTGLMTVSRTARHGISARICRIKNSKTMEFFTYGLQVFQIGRALPFGLDYAFGKSVIAITEGDVDALAMMCAGVPTVSISGIQNVSRVPEFFKGMAGFSIIDALDSDTAGKLGSGELEGICRSMGVGYKKLPIPQKFNNPSTFWSEAKPIMETSVLSLIAESEANEELVDYIVGPPHPDSEDFRGDYIDVFR